MLGLVDCSNMFYILRFNSSILKLYVAFAKVFCSSDFVNICWFQFILNKNIDLIKNLIEVNSWHSDNIDPSDIWATSASVVNKSASNT